MELNSTMRMVILKTQEKNARVHYKNEIEAAFL